MSRSFGTSIGGSIGIALYLSQAISVAFYMVAFAEAFKPVYEWLAVTYELNLTPRRFSRPCTLLLILIMLTKGAGLGVRALWGVAIILGTSITLFMLGEGGESTQPGGLNLTARIDEADKFGTVFATCFPAFTGMIAGLGLSGDLKNPRRSIPLGTIGATLAGMVIYVLVAIKLAQSASPQALAANQFVMVDIAMWGPVIYIGLGAAALSSAIRVSFGGSQNAASPCPRQCTAYSQGESPAGERTGQHAGAGLRDLRVRYNCHGIRGDRKARLYCAYPQHVLHGNLRRALCGFLP